MQVEATKVVYCGAAKFTLSEDEVVTQYDHMGRVVGIFKASDTPSLRVWLTQQHQ